MKSRLLALAIAIVAFTIAWTAKVSAHEMRAAEIDIDAVAPTQARVMVTSRAASARPLGLEAPAECSFVPESVSSGVLHCAGGLAGRTARITGLGEETPLAVVRFSGFGDEDRAATSVVTARARDVVLPGAPNGSSVARRYLRLGAEHVIGGLDHVLFMIALFWQAWSVGRGSPARTAWELARTATAFTLAHSLTLVATVLGLLHVPTSVAEACIAWSLVLVALDVRSDSPDHDVSAPRSPRVALAATFGLVHGLGFAGALADTRIPEGARAAALLCFNAGVELGQLAVFGACLAILTIVRRTTERGPDLVPRLATISAHVVGITGSTLFFLRTLALLRG